MIDPKADPWFRTPAEDALVQIAALHVRLVADKASDPDTCSVCMAFHPCDTLVLCQIGGVPR